MKTGTLGGTFSPPHYGHLIVAERVREEIGLERIFFVPTAVPPHKQGLEIVDARHRLAMLELAVQGNRHFIVSDIEVQRGGVSFTVDTLAEFRRLYPKDEFFVLIGMDNFVEFRTWRSPEKILNLSTVVVMTRPGTNVVTNDGGLLSRVRICEVPDIEISSSDIRRRVAEGRSIRYLVPAAVERYIHQHQLYTSLTSSAR